MSLSIKKDDYVKIISGKDRGKAAHVIAVDIDNNRALIEGSDLKTVNKKAVKARKANEKGGIVEQPGSIHISNIMPICAHCGKATRVGHKEVDGKNVRVCVKCGKVLETKKIDFKKAEAKKATVRRKANAAKTEEK